MYKSSPSHPIECLRSRLTTAASTAIGKDHRVRMWSVDVSPIYVCTLSERTERRGIVGGTSGIAVRHGIIFQINFEI